MHSNVYRSLAPLAAFILASTTHAAPDAAPDEPEPALDLIVAMDASGSVGPKNWELAENAVLSMVEALSIDAGPTAWG